MKKRILIILIVVIITIAAVQPQATRQWARSCFGGAAWVMKGEDMNWWYIECTTNDKNKVNWVSVCDQLDRGSFVKQARNVNKTLIVSCWLP